MPTTGRTTASRSLLALFAAAALFTAACGTDDDAGVEDGGHNDTENHEQPTAQDDDVVTYSGVLAPAESAHDAYSYDNDLAPEGAQFTVESESADGSTTVRFTVQGMVPDRGYAVHAHTQPCGADGADAGPHFQHEEDPAAGPGDPSTDPEYANPTNEIWLDLTTDGDGAGSAETEVPFTFDDHAPASIVVHAEERTATEAGEAGTAGDRVACLTVPFA